MLLAMTLSLAGCGWSSAANRGASITVELPPARPAVPAPSFSFGAAPRTVPIAEAAAQ